MHPQRGQYAGKVFVKFLYGLHNRFKAGLSLLLPQHRGGGLEGGGPGLPGNVQYQGYQG